MLHLEHNGMKVKVGTLDSVVFIHMFGKPPDSLAERQKKISQRIHNGLVGR